MFFEGSGKMELVGITHSIADVVYTSSVSFSSSAGHAVADKKFLRTLTHCVAEDFAEVAAVQIAESGNVLHRYVVLEVLFNEGCGLTDIKVLGRPVSLIACGRKRAGQIIQEQIKMANRVKGRLVGGAWQYRAFHFSSSRLRSLALE